MRWVLVGVFVLVAGAARAQWVEPRGQGWVQLALFHHDTRARYDENGTREPFFAEGHAVTTSLYLTSAVGLVRGVDAWLQVPVHWLRFDDVAADRTRAGPGDPRLYVRIGPTLAGGPDLPIALRAGVKLPGGDFPVDAEVIPLGEGQRDWEVILEVGHSFYPRPLYAMVWLGHRWREPNEEVARDPGNEAFAYGAFGGSLGRVRWKVAAEGWRGVAPVLLNIPVPSARRMMVQVLPAVGWQIGPGTLEVGGRLPLAGRNLPAGPALMVGYITRWGGR